MSFKIIHTSDWHLGKKLFKSERRAEQEAFLSWLLKYIIKNEINLLIIAGDIYDVPSPPNFAQKMFYDFIFKLKDIENFQSILITGNHDSSSLFGIPKEFFALNNCHIYSELSKDLKDNELIIDTNSGTLGIKLLPYFRNFELLNHVEIDADQKSLKSFFTDFFSTWNTATLPKHKILVSHHGFGHYSASGSEHAIHLSGIDHFPLDWVTPYFDYTALGHIHKKQELSKEPPIVYCGSPLPLRFSEGNKKYISEIEIDEKLKYKMVEIPISKSLIQIKTDFINLEGELEKLLNSFPNKAAYLEVIIHTDKPLSGIADSIRLKLQDTQIELLSFIPHFSSGTKKHVSIDTIQQTSLEDLFTDYYKIRFEDSTPPHELRLEFQELLKEVRNNENS